MNLDSLENDGLLEAVLLDVSSPKRDLLRGRYKALVNVAKAAEEAKDYVQCVLEAPYCGDCPACRFRETLAALEQRP